MSCRSSRMLKKSLSSPAKPWCTTTHLSPRGVLTLLRGSTCRTEYASPLRVLRPCWTNFLGILPEVLSLPHLENVRHCFDEALRVLQSGGRVIIMDPYISVSSWPVYHFLHPEPVDFGQDPLVLSPMQPGRRPFDANQAISTILFERSSRRFHEMYPTLKKLQHHLTGLLRLSAQRRL